MELCEEDEREQAAESLRLTYVAATRAQRRLILSGTPRNPIADTDAEASPSAPAVDLLLAALADAAGRRTTRKWSCPPLPQSAEAPFPAGRPSSRCEYNVQAPTGRWSYGADGPPVSPALEPTAEPTAPLLPAPMRAANPGHLSYSALADYAGCVSLLRRAGARPGVPAIHRCRRRGGGGDEGAEADELIDPELGSRERSLAIGNCVHAALEQSARSSWAPTSEEELEAILVREGIAGHSEARARVEALLENWLGSELRAELESEGARPRPEVPFVVELGGAIVRGKIDLLCERLPGRSCSTTRRTRLAAPTKPSWRNATRPSATCTRSRWAQLRPPHRIRPFAPPTASWRRRNAPL